MGHIILRPTPLVYVAAPFTTPDRFQQTRWIREAEDMAKLVVDAGAFPVMPTVQGASFDGTASAEFWYIGTEELLFRCDAAIFHPSWRESKGCVREHELAQRRGIPTRRFLSFYGDGPRPIPPNPSMSPREAVVEFEAWLAHVSESMAQREDLR